MASRKRIVFRVASIECFLWCIANQRDQHIWKLITWKVLVICLGKEDVSEVTNPENKDFNSHIAGYFSLIGKLREIIIFRTNTLFKTTNYSVST